MWNFYGEFPEHSLKERTSKKRWWRGRYNSLGRRKCTCNHHGGNKQREQGILQVRLQCKVRRLIAINSTLCWQSPGQTPGWWFKGMSLRTQHESVLTAMMYYSKRIQGQSAKRKGTAGKVCRKPDSSFWVLSHRTLQQAGTMHAKCCLLGKLTRDPVLGCLVGAGHRGTPLISMFHNFRLQEWEHVCSINHIV